jgi:biotin synthase-like enzyme
MLEELIAALGDNGWAIAGAVILGVAGSTAASTLITEYAATRRAGTTFKREVREKAIRATADARAVFLNFGDQVDWDDIDPARDTALMAAESAVHSAVASTGHADTYDKAQAFIDTGVKYAGHNEETSREDLDDAFKELMKTLVDKLPG